MMRLHSGRYIGCQAGLDDETKVGTQEAQQGIHYLGRYYSLQCAHIVESLDSCTLNSHIAVDFKAQVRAIYGHCSAPL